MQVNRQVLLAKIQTALGTPAVPVPADDSILCEQPQSVYDSTIMTEYKAVQPSHGMEKSDFGGALKTITVTIPIRGTGIAYSASVLPELDALWRMCAHSSTVDTTVSSETVTYSKVSSGFEYGTIYYYQDGMQNKLTDCLGNAVVDQSVDGGNKVTFTITGKYTRGTDVALPTPTYDSVPLIQFLNASFTTLGYAAAITKLSFDPARVLAKPKSANSADGFADIEITDGNVTGSFDPLHTLVAVNDWYGQFENGTEGILTTGDIGPSQYNKINITFPRIYYTSVSDSDREGIHALDVQFHALKTTADDEYSIVYK